MNKNISILLVEDNDGDFVLTKEMLRESKGRSFSVGEINLSRVDSFKGAVEKITSERFDLILLDLSLPDAHGVDTFYCLRALSANVPVVILSGLDDEATALKAVQAGAQDYLIKGAIDSALLARSVRYAVERNQFLNEIQGIKENAVRSSKVKTEFLYHVADDLQQMLLSALELADLGRMSMSLSQKEESCTRVSNLLRSVRTSLDFVKALSHLELDLFSLNLASHSLHDLVNEIVADFDSHTIINDLRIQTNLTGLVNKNYVFDYNRLKQIIECFSRKMILFTSHHELMVLKVANSSSQGNAGVQPDIHFSISMGGKEILPAERQLLFESLSQTDTSAFRKYGPSGLELFVCARIVGLMGGKVWITSTKTEGTVLHWTIR